MCARACEISSDWVQAKGENACYCVCECECISAAPAQEGREGELQQEKREKNKAKRGVPLENPFAVCFGGRNAICRQDNSFLILLERDTKGRVRNPALVNKFQHDQEIAGISIRRGLARP